MNLCMYVLFVCLLVCLLFEENKIQNCLICHSVLQYLHMILSLIRSIILQKAWPPKSQLSEIKNSKLILKPTTIHIWIFTMCFGWVYHGFHGFSIPTQYVKQRTNSNTKHDNHHSWNHRFFRQQPYYVAHIRERFLGLRTSWQCVC